MPMKPKAGDMSHIHALMLLQGKSMIKFGWKIQKQTFMNRIDPRISNRLYIHVPSQRGYLLHPVSSFFLDKEQPEVPEEKAESVPDQPLQEAWQGSAATWKEVV